MSETFRTYLHQELARRSKSNPTYSLRAFARQLNMDSSFLSKLLSGQRSVTNKTIERLGERLGFGPNEYRTFLQPVRKQKNIANKPLFHELDNDMFSLIADWYHYAILELIQVNNFQANIPWVAKALGISFGQASDAVNRLKRLNMLEIKNGEWTNISGNNTTISNRFSSQALRQLQKQILEQSIYALENTPFEQRDQSSITFCVSEDLLPEAKEKIKKFRRELMTFLESGKKKSKVYQLSISLFPVSHAAESRRTNA